jgi:hypothetical protein
MRDYVRVLDYVFLDDWRGANMTYGVMAALNVASEIKNPTLRERRLAAVACTVNLFLGAGACALIDPPFNFH